MLGAFNDHDLDIVNLDEFSSADYLAAMAAAGGEAYCTVSQPALLILNYTSVGHHADLFSCS